MELFGYDSDTAELAGKGKKGKVDLKNQRIVKENNAGREIVGEPFEFTPDPNLNTIVIYFDSSR